MTSDEIARLLETFRKKFTPDAVLPAEIIKLWNEQFRDCHRDLMRPAAIECLANETRFPKPARLRWYITQQANADKPEPRSPKALVTPEECIQCDRGWVNREELYPCPTCRADQHSRWRNIWVPQAMSNKPIKASTVFTYNPQVMLDRNRQMLSALTSTEEL